MNILRKTKGIGKSENQTSCCCDCMPVTKATVSCECGTEKKAESCCDGKKEEKKSCCS